MRKRIMAVLQLGFFDSPNRTLCSARAAVYAKIRRNFKLAVAFRDSIARAYALAAAASNTVVCDFVSHCFSLLP